MSPKLSISLDIVVDIVQNLKSMGYQLTLIHWETGKTCSNCSETTRRLDAKHLQFCVSVFIDSYSDTLLMQQEVDIQNSAGFNEFSALT